MNKLIILVCLLLTSACSPTQTEETNTAAAGTGIKEVQVLYRTPAGDAYELGEKASYVNQKGETVIAAGKYSLYLTDTIAHYGIVLEKAKDKPVPIAIDTEGNKLYEVYWYDNGADYPSEGLFRIIKDGKIGYADDVTGRIMIAPQFQCANPFEGGKAKVALECKLNKIDEEHSAMDSKQWIYIDKTGEVVK